MKVSEGAFSLMSGAASEFMSKVRDALCLSLSDTHTHTQEDADAADMHIDLVRNIEQAIADSATTLFCCPPSSTPPSTPHSGAPGVAPLSIESSLREAWRQMSQEVCLF